MSEEIIKPKRIYDEKILREFVREALNENPWLIIEYKSGKQSAFNSIVSVVMKKTEGRGDSETIRKILIRMIK
ncbi:MAG: GatB/YqeY domain-containing protein [Candidatus Aenigmatarchaeota archaeon]